MLQPHDHHQPLKWIKENLHFPPIFGSELAGHKVGRFILEYQEDIIRSALQSDGRANKNIFMGYTRKIAKSLLYSWIFLYLLHNRPGKQLVCMASKFDQANLIHSLIRMELETNKRLKRYYKFRKDFIENKQTFSKVMVLPTKPSSNLGLFNISGITVDEVGAWNDRASLTAVLSGMRSEGDDRPLILMASNPPESLEHWSLPYIDNLELSPDWTFFRYEIPSDKDVFDENNWAVCNPLIKAYQNKEFKTPGHEKSLRVSLKFMQSEARRAKQAGGPELLDYKRYLCGQRVSADAFKFVEVERIKCISETDFLHHARNLRFCLGCDLAFTHDFCSFALVGFDEDTDEIFVKAWNFLARGSLANRRDNQKRLFLDWHNSGHIIVLDTDTIEPEEVTDEVKTYLEDHGIHVEKTVFDPYLHHNFSKEFYNIETLKGTATNLTGPIRRLQKITLDDNFYLVDRNPSVIYMLQNSLVNMKSKLYCNIDRQNTSKSIDVVVAILNALKPLTEKPKLLFEPQLL